MLLLRVQKLQIKMNVGRSTSCGNFVNSITRNTWLHNFNEHAYHLVSEYINLVFKQEKYYACIPLLNQTFIVKDQVGESGWGVGGGKGFSLGSNSSKGRDMWFSFVSYGKVKAEKGYLYNQKWLSYFWKGALGWIFLINLDHVYLVLLSWGRFLGGKE